MCYFNQSQYTEWYLVQSHTQHTHTHTIPHLCPPCRSRVDVQDPGILQSLVVYVHSPNHKQLGIILSIVEATGSVGVPTNWPKGSFRLLKFGPLLGKLKCSRLNFNTNSTKPRPRNQLRYCHYVSVTFNKFKLLSYSSNLKVT